MIKVYNIKKRLENHAKAAMVADGARVGQDGLLALHGSPGEGTMASSRQMEQQSQGGKMHVPSGKQPEMA